jgi:predicted nucleotide-binding protein (sugar kinase/HSP70/actin superfamily)
MREEYTILSPQMAPLHFELIEEAARLEGYKIEVLPDVEAAAVEEGLKTRSQRCLLPINPSCRANHGGFKVRPL